MTATDARPETMGAPAPSVSPATARRIIGTLLVAAFVVILNETIMGVALPRLMGDLGVDARTGQWLTTAFMLTMAVVIPTTGFLLQRLSTRTVFGLAMTLFSAGTLLAAVSPGFWLLLPARVIQASGTAVMIPLLMTTVLTLVPIERRGVVMGNISIAISVAPAIGPTISGLVLQFLSWRFMFVLVLPIALAALAYGLRTLTDVGETGRQRLDLVSVLLSVPGFGGIVYGLSQLGQESAVGSSVAITSLVVGVLCLLAFGVRQRGLARSVSAQQGGTTPLEPPAQDRMSPLLNLRPFGFRAFSVSLALLCIAMLSMFGVLILLPIYLQTVRGIDSLPTGLMLLPGGLLMGLLGPVVGRVFDRYGPVALCTGGAAALTVVLWRFSTVDATTPIWLLVGLHVVMMVALACLFTPCFTSGLNPLPPQLYSHGSAILATLQQVAGAAGTALLVAIMVARTATLGRAGQPETVALNGGISTAFGVAALISLGAVVLALFMRNPAPPPPAGSAADSADDADVDLRAADGVDDREPQRDVHL